MADAGDGMRRELVIRRGGPLGLSVGLEHPQAAIDTLPWGDLLMEFGDAGLLFQTTLRGEAMTVSPDYLGFAQRLYKEAPAVFALIANRMMLFQEARLAFARILPDGRKGDLFTSAELQPLQQPWPGGTSRELLALAEMFNSIAGNAFFARRPNNQLRFLRPDWTSIILGSENDPNVEWYDIDAEVVGYLYEPGGGGMGAQAEILLPEEVIHYKPMPDPECPWRGMSWLTPIVQEALADKEMTAHKRKYLQRGGTPNVAVTLDPEKLGIESIDDFKAWVKAHADERERAGSNPYKWFYSVAGADPKVIGSNLQNMDFSAIQAAGEVRMAAAGMVHPAIAGFSEGLQGSALNAGNLKEAFRQFASGTMRPLWGSFADAAGRVVQPPSGGGRAALWYDDRDVPALKEDIKDLAEVQQNQASMMSTLINVGFTRASVVDATVSGDFTRLQEDPNFVSVQLHGASGNSGSTNGSGNREAVPAP